MMMIHRIFIVKAFGHAIEPFSRTHSRVVGLSVYDPDETHLFLPTGQVLNVNCRSVSAHLTCSCSIQPLRHTVYRHIISLDILVIIFSIITIIKIICNIKFENFIIFYIFYWQRYIVLNRTDAVMIIPEVKS